MTDKPGTEWTEAGQGATAKELARALQEFQGAGYPARTMKALARIPVRLRTNLRLTGAPLTAEDVANIGRAK